MKTASVGSSAIKMWSQEKQVKKIALLHILFYCDINCRLVECRLFLYIFLFFFVVSFCLLFISSLARK
uniref:Uncharacterized protein n=1 Tax=Anguilla anguilla TaxID=7936 RepID=A0A0E9XG56_ANGAN